ncbi:Na+/H+ antiporter subunit E [Microlunatus parietis]|uniref:Multicomponent Na+:H+ antiporter subunit E n=1 Tax=Microlunatus parietis TaxID=682979 RepID=A0A7Y9LF87_9ACTN|nr:Na+/H+ antiporter subunit E [Microlunatus parietis]NYE74700.1 multicomponent Na+:H+ antiporter subunit E [Microlunatus parietis]
MNTPPSDGGADPGIPPRRNGLQPATIIVLAVVWIVLWGEVSLLIVISGLVVGLVITVLFPLPPVPFEGRLRPLHLIWTVLRLIGDLALASVDVVRTILRPTPPRGAVVRVQLRSESDLYQTLTAEMVSLVPGSIVIEARRSSRTLYLHVLDATGPGELDRVRREVRTAEQRVLASLGSKAERARLTEGEAS